MGTAGDLRELGFTFNRGLGQNFIFDTTFLASLVGGLSLDPAVPVLEIGTGAGTLTRAVADVVNRVVTVEIDKRLCDYLSTAFTGYENIRSVSGDGLKMSDDEIHELLGLGNADGRFNVVANIPYYITTPLIMKFLKNPRCVGIYVLVQDDVAKRITARAGGRDYGALSVALQSMGTCKIVKNVPRGMFTPIPNVDSAFVSFVRKDGVSVDAEMLERLLKGMFSQRRKNAVNSLSAAMNISKEHARELLLPLGVCEGARPEDITVSNFIALCNSFPLQAKK